MVCMIAPRMLQYNKLSCRQKPRLARSVNHAQRPSKSLFRGGKGKIQCKKTRFPCRKKNIPPPQRRLDRYYERLSFQIPHLCCAEKAAALDESKVLGQSENPAAFRQNFP